MNCFDEYVKQYDMNIPEISYKYYHSYRVMDNMTILAKNLSLPKSDIELAKCIGLLHDIGRFYQFTKYHSFNDLILDHGNYGEKILREASILKHFDIPKEDYEIVYIAIRNHNKFEIEPNLSNKCLLFTKMIRDADKLDILYSLGHPELKSILKEDNSPITSRVSDEFYLNKPISKRYKETLNDNLIVIFSFIYEINFNITMDIIKKEKYYQKIYDRLTNKELFLPYIKHIDNYLNERID